nr:RRP12-like protein [Ipomoea trifida]
MEGSDMEFVPAETLDFEADDFCAAVLSQFSDSGNESHVHICTAIGAMSQELKDQNLPLTPITYFGATCSSLQRVSTAEAEDPQPHLVDALSTILSLVIDKISRAALLKKFDYTSNLLARILRQKTTGVQGILSCLKGVSYLLLVREKANWADVAELYGFLVGFMADDRPKVRKQSHICLREVLQKFQMSPMLTALLVPASEAIGNVFERSLLLAGGSNASAPEGPKGAQEVLYILDALKICLPFMSVKSSVSILKYFKSLLELRQPLVTRRITDGINALCIHPTGEVSPEVLLDLLCSLATSISAHESSADSMTFTSRLLDVGMKRIYSLNRQICVVKLPVVFSALSDVLVSEHEEALVAAKEAFKNLINTCIDENLIKQGVDQVMSSNEGTRKSAPTIIEKVCATIESLLDYQYAAVWDISFQIVSTMFDKLGQYSSYFLKGALKNLAEIQKLPDEDFPFRKQLHECVGSAIGAMGPEAFLSILPLNLDSRDLSEANLWLFPILKHYIVGAHLSFFTKTIMSIIAAMKQRSAVFEQEGKIISARTIDGIVYSLWSLLPSFCNYPLDTADSFKALEKVLNKALREEPDVHGIICSGLHILIEQNKSIVEGKEDLSNSGISIHKERAIAHYTSQVAADNLSALRVSARELLSILSGAFLKSSKDTIGPLQTVIGELASISDKEVVTRFFKSTMQKLLKVTQEAGRTGSKDNNAMQVDNSSGEESLSSVRAQLFDLAVSLLPGLDSKEIDLLFIAIEPALKDTEGLVQKRAYKVLSIMLQKSDEFTSRRLDELLNLMIEVLPSCHFSAKRHRLDCLYFLIVHISKDNSVQRRSDLVASFLTEILLALKEANKRTRNRAYDILVQIGHACADEERGGKKEHLEQFFNMVAGGLAGETPHMISAAMKGLARLAYEFTDLVAASYNVLPSAFLLLRRKNKEIIKANLGLLKVLVAKSQAEGLQAHLRGMVEGLLNWQDSTKNHFKAKIKLLLEMLVKKCGLDAVKEVMPEEHMKLLTNIRKIKERREKKFNDNSSEESKSRMSKATTSRLSRWNHTKVFSDFGDDESEDSEAECMDTKTISGRQSRADAHSLRSKKTRKSSRSLQEDLFDQLDDEPLDLLDQQKTRLALRSSGNNKRKAESDDEMEIDAEGHLIIREEDGKPKRKKSLDSEADVRSEAGSRSSMNSRKTQTQKRRKTSDAGWAYTGNEYSSKKASGDVKRKGKLEPYAYWPLDRKMMSRRPEQRAAARKGMSSVVQMTKKLEGKSVANALKMKGAKGSKKKVK